MLGRGACKCNCLLSNLVDCCNVRIFGLRFQISNFWHERTQNANFFRPKSTL